MTTRMFIKLLIILFQNVCSISFKNEQKHAKKKSQKQMLSISIIRCYAMSNLQVPEKKAVAKEQLFTG